MRVRGEMTAATTLRSPTSPPNAPLYRQVMRTFLAAKERLAVHLRPEDVCAALHAASRPADPDAVTDARPPAAAGA
ncbi:hypothetical protein GCM10022384_63100 [Streptomyces marokkonensis]|uniref:Uncharacterized protein n=1 Tax=Streptomyces marokkonensis TaxID=324855 RepID=A0ABP7S9P3_9ACTN